jgi:hypothetical protein
MLGSAAKVQEMTISTEDEGSGLGGLREELITLEY